MIGAMKQLHTRTKWALGVAGMIFVFIGLFWWLAASETIPVLSPSGIIADKQLDLIILTIVLSAIVVIPVFTLLGVFAWKYRETNTAAEYKPDWSENRKLEFVWWGIPIVIIAILAVVTFITSHTLDPYRAIESDKPPVQVQVVALQWKWLFIYPEQGVASVNDLTIPVDRPVQFTVSADAPMSAFWIPALGSQIYTMNGMSSQLNLMATERGDYKGYNTNINGEGYADMTFDVHAVDETAFADWSAQRKTASSDELSAESYRVLAQPGVLEEPKYYRLGQTDVYRDVIMKYMHGGNDTKTHRSDSQTMTEDGV